MAKELTYYFSHDYSARQDHKIKRLLAKHGPLGYGLFWMLIEDLYCNANALPTDYDTIAHDLRADVAVIKSVVEDFNLFVIEGNIFSSSSVSKRLQARQEVSEKARLSASKRWNKTSPDANALPVHCTPNAIKESKVKESKEKKIKNCDERKASFASSLKSFENKYSRDMLNQFYKYWAEKTPNGTKMRLDFEKTWDLDRRLETWASRDKNFKAKEQITSDSVYKGTFMKNDTPVKSSLTFGSKQ